VGNPGAGIGVAGFAAIHAGVQGTSTSGEGVIGESGSGMGVWGVSTSYTGVRGWSNSQHGVYGETLGGAGYGVYGTNSATSTSGYLAGTYGVFGQNDANLKIAIYGTTSGSSATGVSGVATGSNGTGVAGMANAGTNAWGVYGASNTGYAGYFAGKVNITGTLSKGGGSFKIDHPLDPEHKYLYHSFVESPDMMDIYNGTVVTDASGFATVNMPEWFEALNRDFRYQLTVIGGDGFPQAKIAREVAGNAFVIQTSVPGTKVSWQVTGIRHDRFAEAHRIPVEEVKPDEEQGSYLHPAEWGQSPERSVETAVHPRPVEEPESR